MQKQARDDRDGRYTFDGNLGRLCVCGHTLGNHAASAPHECFCPTLSKLDLNHAECECKKFRQSRKKK